jgi:hypothetical protein
MDILLNIKKGKTFRAAEEMGWSLHSGRRNKFDFCRKVPALIFAAR